MIKPITPERAIEAVQICLESMTDSAIAYQNIRIPECLSVACVAIVSNIDCRNLENAGFYCMIARSYDVVDWGLEIRIYERN